MDQVTDTHVEDTPLADPEADSKIEEAAVTDESVGDHQGDQQAGDAEDSEEASPLRQLMREAEVRNLPYEQMGDSVLRVFTGSSDVVMTTVPLLGEITGPVGLVAENGEGASAVIMRSGSELFVVKRKPGSWEHFDAPGGILAILASWRNGERTRFRRRHGALWQAIPEARALAEQLGLTDELPVEVPPPPPPPAPEKPARRPRSTAPKTTTPRAGTKPPAKQKVAEPEPLPPVCPRCFTVMPLSGICDC